MPHSEALLKLVGDLSRAVERANTGQTEALIEIQERVVAVERAVVRVLKENEDLRVQVENTKTQGNWTLAFFILLLLGFAFLILISLIR